jgi:hypothetical protein
MIQSSPVFRLTSYVPVDEKRNSDIKLLENGEKGKLHLGIV